MVMIEKNNKFPSYFKSYFR